LKNSTLQEVKEIPENRILDPMIRESVENEIDEEIITRMSSHGLKTNRFFSSVIKSEERSELPIGSDIS
jgi:hypothetical protein